MPDPASYITAKIAAMIGGFFGGAAILTFIRPKTVGEAFMRGGVSVGSAIIFSSPLLRVFDLSQDWEGQLMAGAVVGFLSYSMLGMVANFLLKSRDKDIVEVVKDIRNDKR
jgi:hypothetical protein